MFLQVVSNADSTRLLFILCPKIRNRVINKASQRHKKTLLEKYQRQALKKWNLWLYTRERQRKVGCRSKLRVWDRYCSYWQQHFLLQFLPHFLVTFRFIVLISFKRTIGNLRRRNGLNFLFVVQGVCMKFKGKWAGKKRNTSAYVILWFTIYWASLQVRLRTLRWIGIKPRSTRKSTLSNILLLRLLTALQARNIYLFVQYQIINWMRHIFAVVVIFICLAQNSKSHWLHQL